MIRNSLSSWEIATQIAKNPNLAQSMRANAPKLTHRAVDALLAGKLSQPSTVMQIRDYLVSESGLPATVFDVNPLTVNFAKADTTFSHNNSRLRAVDLLPYEGVYTIAGADEGYYAVSLIVELERTHNVLLARGVLRQAGIDYLTFLEGYVSPADHQYSVRLYERSARSEYVVFVFHDERRLPQKVVFHGEKDILPEVSSDAELTIPRVEYGMYRPHSREPSVYRNAKEYPVHYRCYRAIKSHHDNIDVFRDGMNLNIRWCQYGAYPRLPDRDPRLPFD